MAVVRSLAESMPRLVRGIRRLIGERGSVAEARSGPKPGEQITGGTKTTGKEKRASVAVFEGDPYHDRADIRRRAQLPRNQNWLSARPADRHDGPPARGPPRPRPSST